MSSRALKGSYITEGPVGDRRLRSPLDDLDRNELAALRWLLWRYKDDTGRCMPSDADISLGTGISPRSIERARTGLRRRGLINWQERRAGGKRSSNEYDLRASLAVCDPEQHASLAVGERELPDNLAGSDTELPDKTAAPTRQNRAELPARLSEESKSSSKEKEKETDFPPSFSEGDGEQQQPGHLGRYDAGTYEAEVQAAEVIPTRVRTQVLAEHREMCGELALLEKQYEANPSSHTERAIETQRVEIANLEGEHADLFSEVAA